MKNNLFLTTALVATAFVASNAMATVINENVTFDDAYTADGQSDTRGGVFSFNDGATFKKQATFTNNQTTGELPNNGFGGAIFVNYISTKPVVFNDTAVFEGNKAISGGAIHNQAELQFDSDATFSNNYATEGGALGNTGNIVFKGKATFENNGKDGDDITETGGALSNGGNITFKKLATFTGNSSTNQGAAFSNSGSITFEDGFVSSQNTGEFTGIANSGTLNVTGGDVIINNNTTNRAAGLHNNGSVNMNNVGKITFTNNTATGSSAGALGVNDAGEGVSLSANTITFSNNSSTGNGYGGAIFTAGNLTISGTENVFSNNTSTTTSYGSKDETYFGGGAIHARAQANVADAEVIIGKSNSTNTFSNNTSNEQGGAIFARNAADITINGTTTFSNNTADKNGGAIYVRDAASKITFNGNTVFEGNTDSTGANDIYNTGTITFNGDVTLDGGISGGTGTVQFKDGTNLTVKAGKTTIVNVVENGTDENKVNLNLNFDNGFSGSSYTLVDTTNGGSIDHEFNIAENTLYNITTTDTKGTYDVSKKSSAEVATETGASQNQAAAVTAITNGEGNNATFNAIAENISDLMQSGSAVGVQLALEAAETLAPEVAPVVLQTATENVGQIFSAVSARLSGGAATAPNSRGMASGDSVFENGVVWAQGLYNHSKLNDTRKAKGYKADSNGLAFGFEKQINENVKAGIGYAYTKTDVDGHNRDLDIDTHTALVYGEYKPSAWFVNAMASYSWSDYDEDKRVLGQKITGDYDAQSYALQAMSGYEFAYDNTIFTPEAGLRYIHISQDGHKDTAGQYVYGSEVDTLTGIAGLRVEQAYALDNGWTLRPSARFAVTYDIANDDGNSAALLANGTAYSVKGEAMDRFGMEADFALTADITDNASVSLGYQGKFRDDYKDHTGLLNLKYNF